MESSNIWDPQRLQRVGAIVQRYSAYLQPGHRIRCGIEGDPCTNYRSVESAPTGVVTEVFREPSGYTWFRAVMDESGATCEFNNRDVERVWEIDPHRGWDEFCASVRVQDGAAAEDEGFRAVDDTKLQSLREELNAHVADMQDFRETMGKAIRELAGDVQRAYRGEATQFAATYLDRYDRAAEMDSMPAESLGQKPLHFPVRGVEYARSLSEVL